MLNIRNNLPAGRKLISLIGLLLLFALGTGLASGPLVHDDTFLHINIGEEIARSGAVPRVDILSFTRSGAPWVTHEWGFALLLHAVYSLGGEEGLIHLKRAIVLAILLLLYFLMRRVTAPGRFSLVLPILLLGLLTASPFFILQASLVSSLYLLTALYLLSLFDKQARVRHIVGMTLLFWIWANFHSGVIFGLFILVLQFMEALLGRTSLRSYPAAASLLKYKEVGKRGILFFAPLAITLLNPKGFELWLYPLRLYFSLFLGDVVWSAGHFASPSPAGQAILFLFLALLLAGLLPSRQLSRISLTEALGTLFFLGLAIHSKRFIVHFVVIASVLCVKLHSWRGMRDAVIDTTSPKNHRPRDRGMRTREGGFFSDGGYALSFVNIFLVTGCLALYRPDFSSTPISDIFPESAVRFIKDNEINGRMFNYQNYGGFLYWRLGRPVFWDGRNRFFESLIKEVQTENFEHLVDRYELDILLLSYSEYILLKNYFLVYGRRWGLVYWDDFTAVYLRRIPKYASVLESYEYRIFGPFYQPLNLRRIAEDPEDRDQGQNELNRILKYRPDSQIALHYKGMLAYALKNLTESKRYLTRAANIRANFMVLRDLAVVLSELGEEKESIRVMQQAVPLAPPG